MISDSLVADVLLETLLTRAAGDGAEYGVVIDGFPRTACQVDVLKLLHERLQELHARYADTPLASRFPRPNFKVGEPITWLFFGHWTGVHDVAALACCNADMNV